MIQADTQLGFLQKTFENLGLGGQLFFNDFDCDDRFEERVLGLVDKSHASLAQHFEDLIASDTGWSPRRQLRLLL